MEKYGRLTIILVEHKRLYLQKIYYLGIQKVAAA